MEESYPGVKLHLGSGSIHWDGWLNVDLYAPKADLKCDLRKLELPSDHADVAVAIHVIEHFYKWEAPDVLLEIFRVLKPGGKLILELPCMDKVLGYIFWCHQNKAPLAGAMSWLAIWGDPRFQDPAMCHKWGYSVDDMVQLVAGCGFSDAKYEEPRYHFQQRDMRITGVKPS